MCLSTSAPPRKRSTTAFLRTYTMRIRIEVTFFIQPLQRSSARLTLLRTCIFVKLKSRFRSSEFDRREDAGTNHDLVTNRGILRDPATTVLVLKINAISRPSIVIQPVWQTSGRGIEVPQDSPYLLTHSYLSTYLPTNNLLTSTSRKKSKPDPGPSKRLLLSNCDPRH